MHLHQSVFKSMRDILSFFLPLIIGQVLFGVHLYFALPTLLAAFTVHLLIIYILRMIDRFKKSFLRTRHDSNENAIILNRPNILRYFILSLLINAIFALFLSLPAYIALKDFQFNFISVKALLFLSYIFSLLISWLTLIFGSCALSFDNYSVSLSSQIMIVGRSAAIEVACAFLVMPFIFAGKIFYASNLLTKAGQSTAYALMDKGDELLEACFLVAVPFHCVLFAASSYPFGLISCANLTYELHLLLTSCDETLKSKDRFRMSSVLSKLSNILEILVFYFAINCFQLGKGYLVSYTMVAFSLFQILSICIVNRQITSLSYKQH